ncbi:lanthionine synthetase LanC family protein [Flavobacterium sp.]|uniref:lanthionine synthetase LanC family protein n=1 Tax=Flavobacterium sp. TaxID=239 RepID=UPI003D6C3371
MDQINKNSFFDAAWNIGCQLMKSSIWHGESCNWQGYSIEPLDGKFQPVIRTFGPDVYSGTSGIALFLAALYSENKDPVLLKTIEGSVQQIKATMHSVPDHGFYSGKPGIAAALINVGKKLDRKNWISEGINLLDSISASAIKSHEIDVVSGVAGTIPVLVDAYNEFNKQEFLDKAIVLGDLLCDAAVKNNEVWSWATVPSQKNLTGFSHGSSGMALALLQLYNVTGNKNYLEGANGGFNYERQSFDTTQQNWPDFRDGVSQPSANVCGLAWCHGAPGITISRLKANQIKADDRFVQEMNTALTTTAKNIYHIVMDNLNNTNYSLCHGIAGNSEVLLDCGGTEYQKLAETVGVAGIAKYQKNDISWPTGLNTNQYTPGLMVGIAGTGYFYLRLLNKDKYKTLLAPGL